MVGDRIIVTTLIQNVTKIYDLLERVSLMNRSMIRYLLSKLLLIEAALLIVP